MAHHSARLALALGTMMLIGGCSASPTTDWIDPEQARLVEVATSDRQWTGLAISDDGRHFVNYPRWSGSQPFAVGELLPDGSVRPYPDQALNSWEPGRDPTALFVCVQAMVVDDRNRLWILDPGNPEFHGVVDGAPKIVVVDLATDRVERVYPMADATRPNSYLNDLRLDLDRGVAYLTDSGNGAVVVLDLDDGAARRVLEDHPSTRAEEIDLVIGGRPWLRNGRTPRVHADGIALSRDRAWVYMQPLTARTLYRVPTDALCDPTLDDAALGGAVEAVARAGASDGLLYGPDGHVYLTSLEHDAIRRVHPGGTVETVIRDQRIAWPDSMAVGPGGTLTFTTARIHEGPTPSAAYAIFRIEDD